MILTSLVPEWFIISTSSVPGFLNGLWFLPYRFRNCSWSALYRLLKVRDPNSLVPEWSWSSPHLFLKVYDPHLPGSWMVYDPHLICSWMAYDLHLTGSWNTAQDPVPEGFMIPYSPVSKWFILLVFPDRCPILFLNSTWSHLCKLFFSGLWHWQGWLSLDGWFMIRLPGWFGCRCYHSVTD